jgi:hypothetical protein
MAQRVYLIVLDDDEPNFEWFEERVESEVLSHWAVRGGFAAMDSVELTVSAEDADPDDYPEGSPRDDGDILSDLGDNVEDLQRQIDQKRREGKR